MYLPDCAHAFLKPDGKCLQGRKNAMKVLKGMMKERMADPDRKCEDFFDHVIQELRREKPLLTETIALDLMFVLLFASFETTALALTLGVKMLEENPKVIDALTVSTATDRKNVV